uniref:Zinc finger LSD1-type domain-containing protein n=1 Tax=Setaria italica TaxID=4555 RepID=K4AG95_SETIT
MVQKLVLVQTYSINTQEDKSNPESTAPLAPPGRGETSDAALARRPAASTSFSFFPEPHRRRRRAGSHPAPDAAMQNQIVCHACRTVLLYPRGAPSVCCALCQAVTTVPPPGTCWTLRFLSSELGRLAIITSTASRALAARNSWRAGEHKA